MSILRNLQKHSKKEKVSFHMPGHKSGKGFQKARFDSKIWELDITELSDTDCLIDPQSYIKEAENIAAEIYGAKDSFFLVNGSTCGILSMFYAAFNEGDKVLVSRDCHRSVINAMAIRGVVPIYIEPLIHEKGFSGGIDLNVYSNAIESHRDAKGIFITSPTYFGIASKISAIANLAHNNNMLLLCDEAHGAHFPFSEHFPKSTIEQGADISVVSLHKTMPCPNQTAVLNLGECRVSRENMLNSINMFQTTSPSFLFLAMMEEALITGARDGESLTKKILKLIPKNEHLYSFDDPFKLLLDFTDRGYNGFEIAEILENKFGIYPELALENCVLLMVSWYNTKDDFRILEKAIKYIELLPVKKMEKVEEISIRYNICRKTPREAINSLKEKIALNTAKGRIAAREITIFPPCIPIIMPGEVFTDEHIQKINKAIEQKLVVTGVENGMVNVTAD